jgi:hypothetical protein
MPNLVPSSVVRDDLGTLKKPGALENFNINYNFENLCGDTFQDSHDQTSLDATLENFVEIVSNPLYFALLMLASLVLGMIVMGAFCCYRNKRQRGTKNYFNAPPTHAIASAPYTPAPTPMMTNFSPPPYVIHGAPVEYFSRRSSLSSFPRHYGDEHIEAMKSPLRMSCRRPQRAISMPYGDAAQYYSDNDVIEIYPETPRSNRRLSNNNNSKRIPKRLSNQFND